MKSAERLVMLQPQHALTLVSSARWMRHQLRSGGELADDPTQQRIALDQLQEAIDATTAQFERRVERDRQPRAGVPWRGYVVAVAAVLAATLVIKACCLLGLPRTVDGLYIPVVVAIAMLIGRGPALVGCALAFVLNQVLFVTPGRFAPAPEQIAPFGVVVLSCLALNWLTRGQRASRLLGMITTLLAN